jgi:hypothetical protein
MSNLFPIRKLLHPTLYSGEEDQHLYAILDTARGEVIFSNLVLADSEVTCLLRGDQAIDLADVAPYLFRLEQKNPFTNWFLENYWGKSWGILFESPEKLSKLKRHFRKYLVVYTEEGKPLYFRYYDPRVLRVYLPTCNEEELNIVFGPVTRFLVEGEKADELLEYTLVDKKLVMRSLQF